MSNNKISANSLALIALTNEYCQAIEQAAQMNRDALVARMLQLLPRIYITVSDIDQEYGYSDYYIDGALDEMAYDQARDMLAAIMADDDVYLEVFLDDMKYSDTPIAVTVSENLADLYQEFYNFINAVRDVPTEVQTELVGIEKDNFVQYWGQTLCNVLRALNSIYY